jgi:hypothetical protein
MAADIASPVTLIATADELHKRTPIPLQCAAMHAMHHELNSHDFTPTFP